MNSFAISGLSTAIFGIVFGFFVLSKGPKQSINILWCLTCITTSVWSFGIGMLFLSKTFAKAHFWVIAMHTGSILIPVIFLHFISAVLKKDLAKPLCFGYTLALLEEWLDLKGSLISAKSCLPYFNFYATPYRAYWFYAIYFLAYVLYSQVILFHAVRKSNGRLQNQLKFILLGTAVGFTGGSTSFFLVFNIPVRPYGIFVVPAYIATVSYAIFKHQLMDINVVFRKTLIYSLVSAALASLYAAIVALSVHFFEGMFQSTTIVLSVFAAGLMGMLFHPVTRQFQTLIDKRFSRKRIDYESRLMEFSNEVATEENLEKMTRSLFQIVGDTLHPTRIALYLQAQDNLDFHQVSPSAQIGLPKRLPAINPWADYFCCITNQ